MADKAGPTTSLAAGTILLAISCLNIGYGLCMSVNGMGNAMMPLGVGVMFAGLSTMFIAKSVKTLGQQAAAPGDEV
ncbi:MAG: hypothetical protein HLUCCX21_01355 [Porphyrobacter sp. HL-46]|nr:MAG: hypothetical protein HLUCCX21_01355 [Porphyrobacter sp. HL-46]